MTGASTCGEDARPATGAVGASAARVATLAGALAVVRAGEQGPEVLIVRRSGIGTFPGAWVLPGGQVEAADRRLWGAPVEVAARAATRELAEEAGVVVIPAEVEWLCGPLVATDGLRRFDVWFFTAPFPVGARVRVDGTELQAFRWLSLMPGPLASADDPTGPIPPATRTALALLADRLAAHGGAA